MKIYEAETDLPREELDKVCNDLQRAIPNIAFTDWINSLDGKITGWSHRSWRPDSGRCVQVFYHHDIAVVNENLKNKEEVIDALQRLGYYVPSQQMRFPSCIAQKYDGEERIEPEEILWDELRKGKGLSLIRRNLEGLLKPLLLSQRGKVDKYEFAVYSPYLVFASDDMDGMPPYWEYDEIFRLPALSNGMVDLGLLLEKIKQIPSDRAIAISSRVKTADGERHIPMIDFKTGPFRDDSLFYNEIEAALGRLEIPKRLLVDSGRSFHHYNLQDLFTLERFFHYMERLAEQPEIGKNWSYLQAFQQFGLLRITPCGSIKPDFPEIHEDIS